MILLFATVVVIERVWFVAKIYEELDVLVPLVIFAFTTCNTDPVGNVLFGMDCDPVMVEPATDEI